MGHKAYATKPDALCYCGYRKDDPRHFRLHVQANRWPEGMRAAPRKERVVIDGKVYTVGSEPTPDDVQAAADTVLLVLDVCETCGFVAASAFGLRAHQRKHDREHADA